MEEKKVVNLFNGDPDYKPQNNSILKQTGSKFETGNHCNIEKLTKTLRDEFDMELNERQKQLEHIQNQIGKAQKLLHLVRYVIITSYYNRPELEYSATEESTDLYNELPSQKRIHPALKKLLGKNGNPYFLDNRRRRRSKISEETSSENVVESEPKRFKSDEIQPQVVCETDNLQDNSELCNRNRKKMKHRIIVGNVSKWIPSIDSDNLTHKWMVYVRGPKDSPDVSHFIQSIKFHLHPSYKPHNIVEISEQPFHLSRRGWGEFPMRLQIFFKCALNKPVDVIHNLKLDQTCSGRQVLGNETVIDLYLYQNDIITTNTTTKKTLELVNDSNEGVQAFKNLECIKNEEIDVDIEEDNNFLIEEVKLEPLDDCVPCKIEHDYCFEDEEFEESALQCDVILDELVCNEHCYSLPSTSEYFNLDKPPVRNDFICNDSDCNTLAHGLGDNYLKTYDEDSNVSYDYRNSVVFLNDNKFSGQSKKNQPLLKKVLQNQIQMKLKSSTAPSIYEITNELNIFDKSVFHCDKYKIDVPFEKYKNIGEILPFLFDKLPLCSNKVENAEYKHLYPFTAVSMDEYCNWNIGKRLNSEWKRAKLIGRILRNFKAPAVEKWNTRALIMYGRSHGYMPITSYTIFNKNLPEQHLIDSCYCESRKDAPFCLKGTEFDVQIDSDSNNSSGDLNRIENNGANFLQRDLLESRFVKHAALDVGVLLKSEELEPGVVINGAETVILQAVKCLINNIVRRARHHLASKGNFDEKTSVISKEEVELAIQERPEIKSILEQGKKRRDMEFYF